MDSLDSKIQSLQSKKELVLNRLKDKNWNSEIIPLILEEEISFRDKVMSELEEVFDKYPEKKLNIGKENNDYLNENENNKKEENIIEIDCKREVIKMTEEKNKVLALLKENWNNNAAKILYEFGTFGTLILAIVFASLKEYFVGRFDPTIIIMLTSIFAALQYFFSKLSPYIFGRQNEIETLKGDTRTDKEELNKLQAKFDAYRSIAEVTIQLAAKSDQPYKIVLENEKWNITNDALDPNTKV